MKRIELFYPSTWLVWLGLGTLWLITRLPIPFQFFIGRVLGKIIYASSSKLREISKINIDICFPEKTPLEKKHLLKKNFESLGIGIIETAMAWWLSDKRLKKFDIKIEGLEFIDASFAKGKGTILLGPHIMCLELIARLLGERFGFAVIYRPHKKKLLAHIQETFRKKYRIRQIPRHNMRLLLRSLKENMTVWYAYDIDAGEKRSIFAPFFGIQTASLNAILRITQLSQATIVPITFYRMDGNNGYEIKLFPAIANIPSQDAVDDVTRLNESLERSIREKPEQYIWQYKRFKTRPAGEKRFY